MNPSILVVDDEASIREALEWTFRAEEYRVVVAASGEEALRRLSRELFDVLITDICLPDTDGIEVLRRARALAAPPAVVVITAYASVDSAVAALRHGAADYVLKPFKLADLKARVARLVASETGTRPRAGVDALGGVVGQSAAIEAVRQQIVKAAATTSHVLITGETGTGKDLVARAIHAASARRANRFVVVNCGAIPEALFESQLFGHARGAFTGAVRANPGLMAAANQGTLLLDEVGELPLSLQVKMLRAAEDKEVWPVGRTSPIPVDCRIIAATNRDLLEEVKACRFRADLFYRLSVVRLHVPPLRERRGDIPLLVAHFLGQIAARLGAGKISVDADVMSALVGHEWKGNVRELQHVLESAAVSGNGERITVAELPAEVSRVPASTTLREAVSRYEREQILEMLKLTGFDKQETARRLGLSLASLYRKLEDRSALR